ncbi:MAG: hypothetical protein HKN17_08425 [Rhodothermales bacterium]|nr:hypothetical protein [Rhodothermales bacterium]
MSRTRTTPWMIWAGLAAVLLATGCASRGDDAVIPGIRLDLDREGERKLLAFYLGGYVPGGAADPFQSGLLVESDGRFFIPDSVLTSDQAMHIRNLGPAAAGDGRVDWDEFEAFIVETWPDVRRAPASVDEALRRYGDWSDSSKWFSMDVTGSMSPYRRRISVELSALRAAVDALGSLDDAVIYPEGTVFVGEHLAVNSDSVTVVETTIMRKREDGLWDYFAYGSDGRWTTTIENEPSDLTVPTQCIGCHFGSRQFEPERSFPAEARPGPSGPRAVHGADELRTSDVTARLSNGLQEHLRRSDTILGLYATLYLARIGASHPDQLDRWELSTRDRLIPAAGR